MPQPEQASQAASLRVELLALLRDLETDEETVRRGVDNILVQIERRFPVIYNGNGNAALNGS